MKKNLCMVLPTLALLLSGCVVTSIYPFFTEKDLVFDPALVGSWTKPTDPSEQWKFEKNGDKGYQVSIIEKTNIQSGRGYLFKLQGHMFLDFFAPELKEEHLPEPAPTHIIARVDQVTPTLKLASMDYGVLQKMLSTNPKALRHILIKTGPDENDRRLVLTADTQELQKFLLKHVADREVWDEDLELKRQ